MKIKKAVIPAAGLGTRMLPISRTVPKEMLPIVDKPAISLLVEEAAAAGAEDILIITGRGKDAIENYFDYSIEYEQKLLQSGKQREIDEMRRICSLANVYFLRQKETKGLGHAVLTAKSFVADDPFYILYGDDIIMSEKPVCTQLAEAYERYGKPACGVKEVPLELVLKYCTLKAEELEKGIYNVTDMIEKPKPEQVYTHMSILGRVLLTPEIFEILEHTPPGAGGEIQLTDAMGELSRTTGMTAVDFEGTRFDLGSKLGFLKANVTAALKHGEVKDEFREFIKEIAKNLN